MAMASPTARLRNAVALILVTSVTGTLLGVNAGASVPPTVLRGTVTKVVDGDTLRISARGFETTVRLIGVDTPETKRPGYPVQCGGPAAAAETARLLPLGVAVRLESDPSQDVRDRYGRFLAYAYRAGRGGAVGSVNYRLVRTGFAKTYVYGRIPFRHAGQFLRAEIAAKKARLGVWGPPCNGNTLKPQRPATPTTPTTPTIPTTPTTPTTTGGTSTGACDPNYSGACIPPPPPDLDCGEISARRFQVVGVDVHHFDTDGDGIACEGAT